MIRYNYHFRHIVNMTHSHYYEQSIIFAHFTTHTYDYVTLLRRMSIWDLDHFLFWQRRTKAYFRNGSIVYSWVRHVWRKYKVVFLHLRKEVPIRVLSREILDNRILEFSHITFVYDVIDACARIIFILSILRFREIRFFRETGLQTHSVKISWFSYKSDFTWNQFWGF